MRFLKSVIATAGVLFSYTAQAQVVSGYVTTAAPSYSNNTPAPLSLDPAGNLRTNCVTGCGGAGSTTANQGTPNAGGATNSWPVQGAGVAGTPAGGVVSVQGVASGTPVPTTPSQATAANLNAQVQGPAASGAAATGNPLLVGCRAATAAPTAVTDGQAVSNICGETGKQIVLPYSIKELAVRGAASSVSNVAVTLIASAGGSLKNYIDGIQCYRSDAGTTAIIVTFNDSASTVMVLPNSGGGGGSNAVFPTPLATAAATAFTFTPGTATTTVYCNAQGYVGL